MVTQLLKHRYLYLLGLPGIIAFILFKYIPMFGVIIAFQDYSPVRGFASSNWVGLNHFIRLFQDQDFYMILRNSFLISLLSTLFLFPAPIILSLMLNEVRQQIFKRTVQTIIYFPHFLSWVVVVSLTYMFLSTEEGMLNKMIVEFGGQKIPFMLSVDYFYGIILAQGFWKDIGWGTIIYLAAIAGVNPSLYEAARLDGAGRVLQIWHVTLPGIMPTVLILFILNLGNMLEVNFEQLWLMRNPIVTEVAEVFDTYVYKMGIQQGKFSYSTAVGVFKSIVGLVMILAANSWANKKGYEGVW